jgi:hypothetical protein
MFAGPNGSGKTTIKLGLKKPQTWFGVYINPDEIEDALQQTGQLDLDSFGVATVRSHLKPSCPPRIRSPCSKRRTSGDFALTSITWPRRTP